MTLWHEHKPAFVGEHAHEIAGDDVEHAHSGDGAVVVAGVRWKRPKWPAVGDAVDLDVQSGRHGMTARF